MITKKFILGIGSQRAGSTFVAKLLSQHPAIAFHPLKELHYFDTIFGIREERILKEFSQNQLTREINKLCNANNLDFVDPTWKWYVKSNLELLVTPISKINYFDLFSEMKSEKIKYVGESTPEYMLLEEVQIAKMREIIGDAYIILVCRNPIKRIISSFRLLLEYGDNKQAKSNRNLDDFFLELIDSKNVWHAKQIQYNQYDQSIARYSKFFDRVIAISYDDIVENPDKIIEQINNFLEIDFNPNKMAKFFARKINSLKTEYKPNDDVVLKLNDLFGAEYLELAHRFNRPLIH
jgi:Sulfotransferase family